MDTSMQRPRPAR